jgi:hypothetical protein
LEPAAMRRDHFSTVKHKHDVFGGRSARAQTLAAWAAASEAGADLPWAARLFDSPARAQPFSGQWT